MCLTVLLSFGVVVKKQVSEVTGEIVEFASGKSGISFQFSDFFFFGKGEAGGVICWSARKKKETPSGKRRRREEVREGRKVQGKRTPGDGETGWFGERDSVVKRPVTK